MKTSVSLLLVLMLSLSSFGQHLERGKTAELRGLTKVFVDTGADAETRKIIIREIETARLGIEFMKTIEECSILLKFNGQVKEMATGAAVGNGNSSAINPSFEHLSVGQGIIALAGQVNLRVLMNYGQARQSSLNSLATVKFAREFVRLYKKANRLK